jgi:hypothetical protein
VQVEQLAPAGPHAEVDDGWHWLLAQQPEHDVESHTQPLAVQCCPVAQAAAPPQWHAPLDVQLSASVESHALHMAPGAPHTLVLSVLLQVVPLQQPLGHEVMSQTHVPATQC